MNFLFEDLFEELEQGAVPKRSRLEQSDSDPGFAGSFQSSAESSSTAAEFVAEKGDVKKEKLEAECDICFETFKSESALQAHQMSNHQYFGEDLEAKFSFQCSKCDQVFVAKEHLLQHDCLTSNRWISKHPIWKVFDRQMDKRRQVYGVCKLCGRALKASGGTTTGLWGHLKKQHRDEFAAVLKAKREMKRIKVENEALVEKVLKEEESTTPKPLATEQKLKRKRRQSSPLWKWFEKLADRKYANCKICGMRVNASQGTTTALWRHLKRSHSDQFIESYRVKKFSPLIKSEDLALHRENYIKGEDRKPIFQNHVAAITSSYLRPIKSSSSEMTHFLMASNLPFAFVDSAPFRRLFKFLSPGQHLKTAPELANWAHHELFKKKQAEIHQELQEDLRCVDGVTFTQHVVRNTAGDRFKVTNIHYIDKSFKVKKYAIDCHQIEEGCNGTEINRIIAEIPGLRESAIKTLVCHELIDPKTIGAQVQTILCLGDVVDGIIVAAVNRLQSVDDVFEKCKQLMSALAGPEGRKMIKKFEKYMPNDEVIDSLKHESAKKNDLKSEINRLRTIITLKPVLEMVCQQEPGSIIARSVPQEFSQLEELLNVLDEVSNTLTKLSENDTVNIHLAVALIFNLQAILQKQSGLSHETSKTFARFLKAELENKFQDFGTHITQFAVANFLNPFYKGCFLRKFPAWNATKNYLAESLSNFPEAAENQKQHADLNSHTDLQNPELNEADRWSLEFFGAHTKPSPSMEEQHSELRDEIKNYLDVSPRPSSSKSDPLEWWKYNESEMPLLAGLARKHLSVPASCPHGDEPILNFDLNFEEFAILRENSF